jgi:hypothetical protein
MNTNDQLTKIYIENINVRNNSTTFAEIANEIYRIYENLAPNAKTKLGGLVADELGIVVNELQDMGLLD